MADVKNFMVGNDENTIAQIETLATCEAYKDSKIRIMADAHVGKSAVIGSTITFTDKVIVNTVGVDVACRVSLFRMPFLKYGRMSTFLKKWDEIVHRVIPTGFNVRAREHPLSRGFPYEKLRCYNELKNINRVRLSCGTLGGGKLSDCLRAA